MEYELIEALLVEKSLGNLSAETAELMDGYIAGKPEYAELAASFEQLSQASQLLTHRNSRLPEFPHDRIGQALAVKSARNLTQRWLATAAVLAVGLGIMFITVGDNSSKPVPVSSADNNQAQVVRPLIDRSMIKGFFDKERVLKRYEIKSQDNDTYNLSIISRMKGLL